MLHRVNITHNLDVYPGVAQVIHPQRAGCTLNQFAPALILSQFVSHTIYHVHGMVKVGVIGYRDIEVNLGKLSGEVAGYPDFAVGYMVNCAVKVAEHGLPQMYFLYQPRDVSYHNPVPYPILVFEEDEGASNKVFYQVLSTKADGYASDAKASQGWCNGYIQFR